MDKLDHTLITSEVCVQCGRCCLFEKWEPDHESWLEADVKMPMNWNGEVASVPVQKLEAYGETWLACAYLVDKKCTNYENRPKLCSVWDCFQHFNITRNKVHRTQPWIDIQIIQEIIDGA